MKRLVIFATALLLAVALFGAAPVQAASPTQGSLALALAQLLGISSVATQAEAADALTKMGIFPGSSWNTPDILTIGDVEDIARDLARLGLPYQSLLAALGSLGATDDLVVAAGNAYDQEKKKQAKGSGQGGEGNEGTEGNQDKNPPPPVVDEESPPPPPPPPPPRRRSDASRHLPR